MNDDDVEPEGQGKPEEQPNTSHRSKGVVHALAERVKALEYMMDAFADLLEGALDDYEKRLDFVTSRSDEALKNTAEVRARMFGESSDAIRRDIQRLHKMVFDHVGNTRHDAS